MALEVQIEKRLADFSLAVSFRVEEETLSVLGASGAGKTMLLRCIAGIENPDRGRIVLNDQVLFDSVKRVALPARERRVGMLFQNYALFPHRTVAKNLAFGLEEDPPTARRATTVMLLERLHLSGLESRYPRELSGGEQQRVALARALVGSPRLLLADEPTGDLDETTAGRVFDLLERLHVSHGLTSIVVTHNMELAARCTRTLRLESGRLTGSGQPPRAGLNPENA